MNKPTALFVCSVMLYLGCNAWDEVWAGQDFVRAITVVLAMIDAMIVWSLLGNKNEDVK